MSLSKTQIYNNALLGVSRKTVNTPDDDTFESNTCNTLWYQALAKTLSCFNWSSCLKTVALDETSSDPIALYENSFQLPNDCVKVVRAYRSTNRDDFDFEWITRGQELLTDESTIYIKYVATPTNTETLNAHITEVLIWNLKLLLYMPMTGEQPAINVVQSFEQVTLPRAKAGDAMESREIEFEESPWVESLYGSTPVISGA